MLLRSCIRHIRPRFYPDTMRSLASSASAPTSLGATIDQPTVFTSTSTSPYFNLAFEEWIFRNTPANIPLLFMYRNKPCVVMGRNQNPWKEVDLVGLSNTRTYLVRRRSGGGTKYHDLGNVNCCFMAPRTVDRKQHAELIARAVQSLGIPAEVNKRNNVVVEGFKIRSAYKTSHKRAYHHGTMLIHTQLQHINDLLRDTRPNLITKGPKSIRSPVQNLRHWNSNITTEQFSTAVIEEFRRAYGDAPIRNVDETLMENIPKIKSAYTELQRWKWLIGTTPEFTYTLENSFSWGDVKAQVICKHAEITAISLTPSKTNSIAAFQACQVLSENLEGCEYGVLDGPICTSIYPLDER